MSESDNAANPEGSPLFAPTRSARRYVPLKSVSAVLLSDECYLAHGAVSNISGSGACLITNTPMKREQRIRVRFSANRQQELFQTEARVVWSEEGMDPHLEIVGVMVGLQFLDVDASLQERINTILEQGLFHEVGMTTSKKEQAVLMPHG